MRSWEQALHVLTRELFPDMKDDECQQLLMVHKDVVRSEDQPAGRNPVATTEDGQAISAPNEIEELLVGLDTLLDGQADRLPAEGRWRCLSQHAAVNRYLNLRSRYLETKAWSQHSRHASGTRAKSYWDVSAQNASWFIDRRMPPPHMWVVDKPRGICHITALRVGSSGLNAHLYREHGQRKDGGLCPCAICRERGCLEDALHFLCHCPLYSAVRHKCLPRLKQAWQALTTADGKESALSVWEEVFSNAGTARWFLLGGNNAPKWPTSHTTWEKAAAWTRPPFAGRWRAWLTAVDRYIADCMKLRAKYEKLQQNQPPEWVDVGNAPTRWTAAAGKARQAHVDRYGSLPMEG